MLYLLAKNPDVQEKLRREVFQVLPNVNSKLDNNFVNKVPHLKACLKETMRIEPVVTGFARGAGRNIVLSGYQIPQNVRDFFKTSAFKFKYFFVNSNLKK